MVVERGARTRDGVARDGIGSEMLGVLSARTEEVFVAAVVSGVDVDVDVSLTGDLKGVLKGERKGFARMWEAASMRRRLAAWVDIFDCDAGLAWNWNWRGVSAEGSVMDQLVGALHCCWLMLRNGGNWDWRERRPLAVLRQNKQQRAHAYYH